MHHERRNALLLHQEMLLQPASHTLAATVTLTTTHHSTHAANMQHEHTARCTMVCMQPHLHEGNNKQIHATFQGCSFSWLPLAARCGAHSLLQQLACGCSPGAANRCAHILAGNSCPAHNMSGLSTYRIDQLILSAYLYNKYML